LDIAQVVVTLHSLHFPFLLSERPGPTTAAMARPSSGELAGDRFEEVHEDQLLAVVVPQHVDLIAVTSSPPDSWPKASRSKRRTRRVAPT
jgi:hypothetical protein